MIPGKGMFLIRGDLTRLKVEAIVNAANASLLGGGGVDGAIHRAAGPELLAECRNIGGCQVGQARITSGYKLPAAWIVHTVGPVWKGGSHGEEEQLASAYRSSLQLANDRNIRSIAFPNISTGVFGFPKEKAAPIALGAVRDYLSSNPQASIQQVLFCCFDEENEGLYAEAGIPYFPLPDQIS